MITRTGSVQLQHNLVIISGFVCRVWSVQFNMFHDQLVLSGSSDSQVMLTRVASIASEPLQHLLEAGDENGQNRSVINSQTKIVSALVNFELCEVRRDTCSLVKYHLACGPFQTDSKYNLPKADTTAQLYCTCSHPHTVKWLLQGLGNMLLMVPATQLMVAKLY